jgi:hypothetical protein
MAAQKHVNKDCVEIKHEISNRKRNYVVTQTATPLFHTDLSRLSRTLNSSLLEGDPRYLSDFATFRNTGDGCNGIPSLTVTDVDDGQDDGCGFVVTRSGFNGKT